MERLTEKDSQGNWGLKGVGWVDIMTGAAITQEVYEKLYGALRKLKDYEDTGLSPDEVQAIERLEKKVPKKPVMYEETNRADCPACGATVRGIAKPFGDFCPKCGQRLDWSDE